jgi:hypothetical protein
VIVNCTAGSNPALTVAELKERLGVKDRQAKNYIKTMKENKIIWQLEGDSGHYSFDLQARLETF